MLTDDDIKKIELLASFGLTAQAIGSMFNRGQTWLYDEMHKNEKVAVAVERGRAQRNLKVAQVAYEMAVSGEFPQMTTNWLRYNGIWNDKPVINVSVEAPQKELENSDQLVSTIVSLVDKIKYAEVPKPVVLDVAPTTRSDEPVGERGLFDDSE